MKSPIRLEDIDEFRMAARVPRSAITVPILRGIRQLHEAHEIEPFLRSILTDVTETPHTSTEIADILTTHVTINRKAVLAAFVNKGKSYSKVTAREVSYQFMRLRQLPNLGLMVFLATGDIYDDAKRDFLQVAQDAGTIYAILDGVDVARLFIASHKVCGADGRAFRDGLCPLCRRSATQPIELLVKLDEELRYHISDQTDSSFGMTKRYRADVHTDPHYSRATLREVITTAIWTLRHSAFHDTNAFEARFRGKNADYVAVYVYVDARDLPTVNWVCRAEWASLDIDPQCCPRPFSDNAEDFNGIKIDWNESYEERRNWFEFSKKEEWIGYVKLVLPEIKNLEGQAEELISRHLEGSVTDAELDVRMAALETVAGTLYQRAGNDKLPPLDCTECDQMFQTMLGMLHNIFLPFATWGLADYDFSQKLLLMRMYLKNYREGKSDFVHEWKKFRGQGW